MRDQYLELSRYHHKIINICEDRVDELLSLLDDNSLSRLFGETVLDKNIIVMNFNNLSNNDAIETLSINGQNYTMTNMSNNISINSGNTDISNDRIVIVGNGIPNYIPKIIAQFN